MKLLAQILILFYSTIVIILLLLYQINSNTIKSFFFKKSHTQHKSETQLEYFHRIGKTDKQIKFDKYTTISVNALQIAPFVIAITTRNPIMYITYASAITISTPIVAFGKKITKEQRPDDKNDLTSFPSGHSMFAFMVTTVLITSFKKRKNKYIFGALSIIIALSIAIGRVIAKRHWYIDVFCGGIFGIIVGIISHILIKKINNTLNKNRKPE